MGFNFFQWFSRCLGSALDFITPHASEEGELTSSPPESPLDDDDLLYEILLRLPPQPSSLPCASLVSKRWLRLISDPGFFRRFRLHHRRNPPLLGFFDRDIGLSFIPTLDSPSFVPPERFSLRFDDGDHRDRLRSLGCRHGFMLILNLTRRQLLVWDPVTRDQHRLAIPSAFNPDNFRFNGAVRRTAGGVHFQVVLAMTNNDDEHPREIACVYSSETGIWGNLISTPLPSNALVWTMPAVLIGDSFYWLFVGGSSGILEFDLNRQILAVIPAPPVDMLNESCHYWVMRAEGGGLGFIFVLCTRAQLWKRNTNSEGVASWVLGRTIELDKLLHVNPQEEGGITPMLGFAEENNVVFMWTVDGVFMIQIDSLQFKRLFKTNLFSHYHPFESVYTAGIGDAHRGAELLHNTQPIA